MDQERRSNSFTEEDRQLLKNVNEQVRQINGTVTRHEEELFGDDTHNTVGVISRVRVLEDLGLKMQTAIKVLIAVGSVLGGLNIIALIRDFLT